MCMCVTQSAIYIQDDMKCSLTVPFTSYRTKCCPCVSIVSSKSDEFADEEKAEMLDKLEREMCAAAVRCHSDVHIPTVYFTKINKTIFKNALRPVFHRV